MPVRWTWNPRCRHSLRELKAVYEALRVARARRGALDFDSHEGELELPTATSPPFTR
jgi:hypothetical protein